VTAIIGFIDGISGRAPSALAPSVWMRASLPLQRLGRPFLLDNLSRRLEKLWCALERGSSVWLLSQADDSTAITECPALAADWTDIQATLTGSNEAFTRLVNRYQQTVAVQMWRFAPQAGVFEDLVHDVFVEAYLSLHHFRGKAPFIHWLRKIAVRVGYRHWRNEARRRRQTHLDAQKAMAISKEPADDEASDTSARLQVVLQRLNPRDRLVITLIYLDQHSVASAAELLGWTQSMVKVQAFRARRKLKKLLQEGA